MKTLLIILILFIHLASSGQSLANSLAAADKHYSLMKLAQEYINKGDFTTALVCIDSARTFTSFCKCGTCAHDDYMNFKILYAKCYYGQGDFKRTIDLLSPDMLDFEVKEELVEKLYESYLKVYTKQEIKNEFINVCNTLFIKKEPSNDEFEYEIKIFNRNVRLYYWTPRDKNTEYMKKQECVRQLKQSEIYKLVMSE